jgi:hypothetical protein
MPLGVQTLFASGAAVLWRMSITPLDTLKTTLQVQGRAGYALLMEKMRLGGAGVLWDGALANAAANFVGNYPWWLTFNLLDDALPPPPPDAARVLTLLRSASLGFGATCVSDCCSNSIRVVKTRRQTSAEPIGYVAATMQVLAEAGCAGLLVRGLGTRLLANGLQSALFSVVWKALQPARA